MMSDEIDIEEHDVLDNPTIRRIFPDLSLIKKEISQYEEDNIVLDTTIEETNSDVITDNSAVAFVDEYLKSQTVVKRALQDEQLEVHLRFKTFLDSLSDDTFEGNDVDFDSTFDDVTPSRPKKLALKNRVKKEIKPTHTFDDASSNAFGDNIPSSSKKITLPVNNMVKKEIEPSDTFDDIRPTNSKKIALTVKNINKEEIKSNQTFVDDFSDTFEDDIPLSSKKIALSVKNINKKKIESNDTSDDEELEGYSSSNKIAPNVKKTDKKEIKYSDTSNDEEEIKSSDGFDDVDNLSLKKYGFNGRKINVKEIKSNDDIADVSPSTSKKSPINAWKREEKEIKSSNGYSDAGRSSYKNILLNEKKIGKVKEMKSKQNNILILGSKPNLLHHDIKITDKRLLKVVLNNIGPFLKASKVYCEPCCILFPNVITMKCHINKIHCLSDGSKKINKRKKLKFQLKSKFQCQVCYVQLSSKSNLVRHFHNVHDIPKTNQRVNKIYETKPPTSMTIKNIKTKKSLQVTKTKSTGGHNCFHCHKYFESQTDLIEHLYDVLNPNHNKSNDTEKEKQKEIPDTVTSKDGDNINNIKCATCAQFFLTQSELDEHNKEIHLNSKSTSNNKNYHIKTNDSKESSVFQGLNESKLIENIQKTSRIDKLIDDNNSLTPENKATHDEKSNLLEPAYHNSMDQQSDDSSHSFIANDDEKQDKDDHSADLCINNILKKEAYQCFICSQYMKSWKCYSNHMVSHNIKNMSEVDKVVFDPKCRFCNVFNHHKHTSHAIQNLNRHICFAHHEKVYTKINIDEKGFNSILFKCFKCEVFFLTANAAKKHSEHEAIFVNWKCLDCHRLFKINDKAIHLKQHVLSKKITAYALRDSALSRVLYKCLKCAVHFSEKEYFTHYAMCDLEMPNSAYCNTCDILINRNDMPFHEHDHKDKNLQIYDFTFIESEIITNIKEQSKQEINPQNPNMRSKFTLAFCSICHCFLSDVGRLPIAHIDGRCKVAHTRMCSKCGLIFTPKGYLSHQMLHDKVKNLTVQAFFFYDIKTKKQIPPAMPKYPSCNICEVHFLNEQAAIKHICRKQRFRTCYICKIKLTESAFKLHVTFHKYKLSSTALSTKESTSFNAENDLTSTTNNVISKSMKMLWSDKIKYKLSYSALKKKESSSSSAEEAVTSTTSSHYNALENSSPQSLNSNVREDANVNKTLYLYTCIPCQFTVNMYDKVVQHCHDHYDYKEKISSQKNEHPNEKFNEKFVTKLKYDPFYIRFENEIWTKHIFEKLTQEQIKQILENSKYKFECRLKMEEIQAGTLSLITRTTLYKCDICRSYIEPNGLYEHASTTCTMTKKYPCPICGLSFSSLSYKDNHEKSHKSTGFTVASYRIILFNKLVHQPFTQIMLDSRNKFILYQCRNCEVVIDKLQREIHHCNNSTSCKICRCSTCGLLFYDQDMNSHNNKHEIIKEYQPKRMIVIMFGKVEFKRDNKLKPSFSGKIYDFTFYKCTTCGLCLISKNNIYKHGCVSKAYESQCPKCYLCFSTEDLKEHLQMHENNLQFVYDDFISNIISFSKDIIEVKPDPLSLNENISEKDTDNNVKTESNASLTQKIYKCSCGLHFLEELNANKHNLNCNPRMKISKQSCFKCDLLFTPGELFNHLLKHHSNKKIQYKYDIINLS